MTRTSLFDEIRRKKSFLCIGLDPDPEKLPVHLRNTDDGVFEFCRSVIDATRDYCVSYKPNLAFFEQYGAKGWETLERIVAHIGSGHFIIADAKRGDIGNTASMYATAFFHQMKADAVTVAPYMGKDSVSPFLQFPGKWAVVLALTSNAGSLDFQLLDVCLPGGSREERLFEHVLRISSKWGTPDNTMYVVGATHPELFMAVRAIVPDHFLLVPGVGAQGGDLESVVRAGMNKQCGLLVNSSRQILYASSGVDFAEKSRTEAEKLQSEMARLLDTYL